MWQRADLKQKARQVLKGHYWQAFIVSLIIIIIGGSHNRGEIGSSRGAETTNLINIDFQFALFIGLVILILLFLRMLIGYALEVGGRKYFIRLSQGDSNLSNLGFGFRKKRYFNIFITMFLRSIYLFLWTLLFIIPGIIKFYAYRMVPYILADNPEMKPGEAIKLSQKMTKGEKLDIFILDLSFLGWFILGALALGIGILFVQPYYDATNAELYLNLKHNTISSN